MKWLKYFDKTALVCNDRRIHYKNLLHGISSLGDALRKEHAPGERIAVIGANSPEWVLALYAVWHAGLVAVPIDYMSTSEEIAYIFQDCSPIAVFTDAASEAKVQEATNLTETASPSFLILEQQRHFLEPPAEAFPFPFSEESPDEDTALIIYTSGTTGTPKGVMLTFGNLRANAEACTVQTEVFIPEDKVLVALPLHHSYPLMGSLVMPMTIGATAVFASSLTGNAIISALRQNQCTFIIGVPRLLEIFRNSMLKKIQDVRFGRFMLSLSAAIGSLRFSRFLFKKIQEAFGGHIRYIASGGAAADPQVTRDFYAMGFHLLEGYGMTETAPMISFTPPDRHKPGSPGKPIPCNEIRIQNGEVLVRGKNVMKGYYNRPEETAQIIDSEGWLHTGDLGYVDKDGFLFLTGRSKELIILGNGKNINPAELEQKLMEYADGMFTECAVSDDNHHLVAILVPDTEALAARGVLNIKQTFMDKVIEPYNEAVPSYKRIARLELSDRPLPRTRLGKLRRHVIRQFLQNGLQGQEKDRRVEQKQVVFSSTLERKICQCLAEVIGRPAVGPDEHFELELNLDSLGKVATASALGKELGREIDMSLLAKYPTGRLLAEALDSMHGDTGYQQHTARAVPCHSAAWTHGGMRLIISAGMRILSRLVIEGTENILAKPCIFAPNHESLLDGFYLASAMTGSQFRNTYFFAISKYFDGTFKRWFAARHNLIPMEINGNLHQSLEQLEAILRAGKSVVIFPEGTRTMDGSLGEFRPMFAQLALKTGVPVVPVAIRGAYDVLPRWAKIPRFGKKVAVRFLAPLVPDGRTEERQLCKNTAEQVQEALLSMQEAK
ncbi:MAG: AMP-binding protein [Lentisphaeria bacterium]|nr:AMP-binding protein [Lentisphaeria bacterium]